MKKNQYLKNNIVFFVALFYFANFLPSPINASTLKDAIDSAQVSNHNIKLEKARLSAIKTEKDQAISEFLPSLKANVQYGNRNSYFKGQTYQREANQTIEEINLEQPIFDGLHSVMKYREADYKIQSGEAKKSDKTQEISFAAAQNYCDLFRYQELVKLFAENKNIGANFLELVNQRKDKKIIDKDDVIKFSYEISATEEKFLDAAKKFNKAKFDYQNSVGALHENLVQPEIIEIEFDKEKVLQAVLSSNHAIKSSHYEYLASKSAYNAEKSAFSPKVAIVASQNKQSNVIYLNNRDLSSRSVFLNVSIPIFQKGTEYSNLNRAKYEQEAAREQYEVNKEEVIKEINKTLEEYNFLRTINRTNKKLTELAKNRVDVLQKRLKIEDQIELIRAKIEMNERMINYINSQVDLVISYYKIKYFLGEI